MCPSRRVVGMLPQKVSVVFNTGSFTLKFTTYKFIRAKSSTFVEGNMTGAGVDPVINSDYVPTFRPVTNSITVGNITTHNTSLFTIIDQTPKFNPPFLWLDMGSFWSVVSTTPCVEVGFDYYYSFVTRFNIRDLVYINFVDNPSFWQTDMSRISINDQSVSILYAPLTIVDSGTSGIVFTADVVGFINAFISPLIQPFAAGSAKSTALTSTDINSNPFKTSTSSSGLNIGPFESDPSTASLGPAGSQPCSSSPSEAFLAHLDGPGAREVVVKIVEQYGVDVHALVEAGPAPPGYAVPRAPAGRNAGARRRQRGARACDAVRRKLQLHTTFARKTSSSSTDESGLGRRTGRGEGTAGEMRYPYDISMMAYAHIPGAEGYALIAPEHGEQWVAALAPKRGE
ncbi:uncharacterized protein BXZ73DRAFT_77789 [Epithele typhae]|uniref:uncharacterized protein n=1 Tax=Epithele typhae TaxID=378194 RepID=UPI002008797C|nr:uncharacterized protein BXZ73DRAFT_77789 [Epithele typhae]KAH9931104.1 hypothetical protein BXZ73DRAFT_77789 [Epithele typhae]